MIYDITIFNLLRFVPLNKYESELFNFDKDTIANFITQLENNAFYLGGQLKMQHNDIINLDSIRQVREINRKKNIEYGEPCNSFEAASIRRSLKELEFIESMIIIYISIINVREKDKLNKPDSNYNI
jgi:hypothetical protein